MDRILTIPNAISAARLAGVPVFLWLVLGPRTATADYWAVALLIVAGLSDWLDGKIARALNQGSRLGRGARPGRGPAVHRGHHRSRWPCGPSSRGGWSPSWRCAS